VHHVSSNALSRKARGHSFPKAFGISGLNFVLVNKTSLDCILDCILDCAVSWLIMMIEVLSSRSINPYKYFLKKKEVECWSSSVIQLLYYEC